MTMQELIERLEKHGGSRQADAGIYNLFEDARAWSRVAMRLPMEKWQGRFDDGWHVVRREHGADDKYPKRLPEFTASVSDALTLLPPKNDWLIGRGRIQPTEPLYGVQIFPPDSGRMVVMPVPVGSGESENLAVALCIASLRARLALTSDNTPER